jgi:hypothetical protein
MNPEDLPLRDLHLPEPIGWWPPAPGWWVVLALALAGLVLLLLAAHRRRRRNAARRLALAELARLEAAYARHGDAARLAAALSTLLRRAMLAYAPREQVARLTGRAWLEWLDRGLERRPFSEGPGQTLAALPYRDPARAGADVDVAGLVEAVRRRLCTPLPEAA